MRRKRMGDHLKHKPWLDIKARATGIRYVRENRADIQQAIERIEAGAGPLQARNLRFFISCTEHENQRLMEKFELTEEDVKPNG